MSGLLMGAVFQVGPPEQSPAFVLLAIADNADDFGFACPSHDTIAAKARCDRRTVIRQIDFLEREGWLKVVRKIINGKSNAYFLNLAKLGVTLSPDARRSPLHSTLLKRNGDILSRIFAPKKSGDTKKFSGDNLPPSQVTPEQSQVTFEGGSGDTRCHLNLLTVIQPSGEPNSPLPPSQAKGAQISDIAASSDDGDAELRRVNEMRAGMIPPLPPLDRLEIVHSPAEQILSPRGRRRRGS